jgi:HEAT repeat protein
MTDRIDKPGLGTEETAERLIELYAGDLNGFQLRDCMDAFKGKIDVDKCLLIQEILRDGIVDRFERMRLLNAGFSGRFVYRLADGDALFRRAQWLSNSINLTWRYSTREQLQMACELGELKWPELTAQYSLPSLATLLMDIRNPWKLRVAIVETLGKMGREAIPVLTKALDINDARVRKAAVQALRRLGRVAIPTLKHAALTNEDPVICRAATKAITKIKNGY